MELKKRDYLIIYTVAAAAALLVVFKTVLASFHHRLSTVKRQVALEEAKLKKGLALIENRETIQKEYSKYASYFSLQGSSNEEAVASFLKQLEKISRDSGVLILDIKPQKEVEEDKVSRQVLINIKAEADIKKLVTFLYGFYTSPLLFSVEKMVLVPKSEGSAELSISLTVTGVSFV